MSQLRGASLDPRTDSPHTAEQTSAPRLWLPRRHRLRRKRVRPARNSMRRPTNRQPECLAVDAAIRVRASSFGSRVGQRQALSRDTDASTRSRPTSRSPNAGPGGCCAAPLPPGSPQLLRREAHAQAVSKSRAPDFTSTSHTRSIGSGGRLGSPRSRWYPNDHAHPCPCEQHSVRVHGPLSAVWRGSRAPSGGCTLKALTTAADGSSRETLPVRLRRTAQDVVTQRWVFDRAR
jgi:hypothetical protein